MPRAVVLLNPRSRSGVRAPIDRILSAFSAHGWTAEIWAGQGSDWTDEAALRARDLGVDAIFGAGGDGLLARILPAVLHTQIALGVVPLGTGNVWARELGLPLHPERAIARQLGAAPRHVDVGKANGRPFLVIASTGLDARIVELVEADAGTKALGQLAYPLTSFALAAGLRGVPTRVWIDDDAPVELQLLAGMVTNGRLYGGLVPLVPNARIDDGVLDVVLFAGGGPLEATAHAARVLAGLHHDDSTVLMRRASHVRLDPIDASLPVQTDGDPLGSTPLEVQVLPGALLALGAVERQHPTT
ncbi:MAG TPA: diacylglycerol kinase family protein [Chloroflexota bacterium]